MINVTIYTNTGMYGRSVALDLQKTAVARRIEKAIGEGTFSHEDMVRLDSGRLSLSRLMLLVPADEIRAGLGRALAKSSQAEELRADIHSLLTEWTLAQGGEPAQAGAPKPGAKPTKDKTTGRRVGDDGHTMAKAGADIVRTANDACKRSGRP